jgi:hypothetical protein
MGIGAATVMGIGALTSSEARTLPTDGSVFLNEGGRPTPAAYEQPTAPTEPKTPEERAADLAKVEADTRKTNADAIKTEADARSTDAQTERTKRETEHIGTFWDNVEKIAPWGAAVLSFLGVVVTGAVTHRKNKRDSFDAREKERLDRKTEENKQTDAQFNDIAKRLLKSQDSNTEKSDSAAAAIELQSFTEQRRYQRRIFDLTVGLLRSRPTPAKAQGSEKTPPPTPLDQDILRAFLAVAGPLRERELHRREAHGLGERFLAAGKWLANRSTGGVPAEPTPVLDASSINIDGMSLTDEDLSYLDLSDASMEGTQLSGAIIKHADLRGADLRHASLKGAVIEKSRVYGLKLRGSNVRLSHWREIDFGGVTILAPRFMQGARITGTKGLDENEITKLRNRGVIVVIKTGYGAPVPEVVPGTQAAAEPQILADTVS